MLRRSRCFAKNAIALGFRITNPMGRTLQFIIFSISLSAHHFLSQIATRFSFLSLALTASLIQNAESIHRRSFF